MSVLPMSRRYDLDWLRVLLFSVLILYHVGMYYVADWSWHIKSDVTSKALQNLMILSNQWRMSLLFFISAMVLALVQGRHNAWLLIRLRSSRLLIPLVLSMLVVVVPQAYFEARWKGLIEPGFLAFWWQYLNPNTELLAEFHGPLGLLTWGHLWFLPYLWCYSVLVLLAAPLLKRIACSDWSQRLDGRFAFCIVAGLFLLIWLLLYRRFPSTHALFDDWYNHGKYFLVFIAGYIFALQGRWWQQVIRYRSVFLLMALYCYVVIIAEREQLLVPLFAWLDSPVGARTGFGAVLAVNHWSWILALIGLAGYWLNKPVNALDKKGKFLRYANDAVLPWYMLHQTLIITFAFWFKPWSLHPGVEAVLLISLTALGCWLGYEVVRRIRLGRYLFGMKATR